MKKLLPFIALIMLMMLACRVSLFNDDWNEGQTPEVTAVQIEPTAQPVVTETAPVDIPPTPMPTNTVVEPPVEPTPDPNQVSFEGVQIAPPDSLGTVVGQYVFVPTPEGDEDPFFSLVPNHVQLDLPDYPIGDRFFEPVIRVYPVEEYQQVSSPAQEIIPALQDLLAQRSLPEHLPFLPVFNAAQVFHAQERLISFQNGSGIRFLTMYGQAVMPVNNQELFYTFQGITDDGRYYVSAIMPVGASYLPETYDDSPPQSGLPPFPSYDDPNFEAAFEAYMDAVVDRLNGSFDSDFTPALDQLDALIRSIRVEEP